MKRKISFAVITALVCGVLYFGHDVYSASQRWARFDAAVKEGNPFAEVKLCEFYYKGHPVYSDDQYPQDYKRAMIWCRRAADQGNAEAQFWVGHMLWLGEGVPKDLVQSYMWLLLAAKQNPRVATQNIPALEGELKPEQIAEGRRRAAEWKPTPSSIPETNKGMPPS